MAKVTEAERRRFSRIAAALFTAESYGGTWNAIGPRDRNGNRAYGIGQVMDYNVGPWTEKYYGRRLTPSQFLGNKDAQIAVLNGEMARYWDMSARHSNNEDTRVRMTAAAWFGGPGAILQYDSTTYSDGYTDMRTYTNKVLTDYNKYSGPATGILGEATPVANERNDIPLQEMPPLEVPDGNPPLGRGIPKKELPPPPPSPEPMIPQPVVVEDKTGHWDSPAPKEDVEDKKWIPTPYQYARKLKPSYGTLYWNK
jgi:hypothetical protein